VLTQMAMPTCQQRRRWQIVAIKRDGEAKTKKFKIFMEDNM